MHIRHILDEEKAIKILTTENYDYARIGFDEDWDNTFSDIKVVDGKIVVSTVYSTFGFLSMRLYKNMENGWVAVKMFECYKDEVVKERSKIEDVE